MYDIHNVENNILHLRNNCAHTEVHKVQIIRRISKVGQGSFTEGSEKIREIENPVVMTLT